MYHIRKYINGFLRFIRRHDLRGSLFLYTGDILENNFIHRTFHEQVELLESRNMFFENEDDKEKAENTLAIIPYYKLKQFARPFAKKSESGGIDYQNTKFQVVVSRYYQDKNLRLMLLHAIEDIEVAIKTKLAYVLGKPGLGSYGYLSFNLWCDKSEYCKYYLDYKKRDFKRRLKLSMRDSDNPELNEKLKRDNSKYPPVWLMIDLLTFGQVVDLLKLMSKNKLKEIADDFDSTPDILISWLQCVNLIRNTCAHNSNIIDIKLTTTPYLRNEWKTLLYEYKEGTHTNRIATPLFVILDMVGHINSKYKFEDIIH